MKLSEIKKNIVLVISLLLVTVSVFAKDVEKIKIENEKNIVISTLDLLKALAEQGIISSTQADEILKKIITDKLADEINSKAKKNKADEVRPQLVRVPYVPEFVSEKIRDEVRAGLKEDVLRDVLGQAKHERWGIPGVAPSWIDRIKLSGDFRLRYQGDFFSDANANNQNLFLDVNKINAGGTFDSTDPQFLHNITEDRHRVRVRLRVAMDAKVTEGVKVGVRLATGSVDNPVSTNQTLGNDFSPYNIVLDRAYIRLKTENEDVFFWGGRMPSPWRHSNLIWDPDLNFDGLALKYRPLQSDEMGNDERVFDSWVTVGAFVLDELALSSQDKWMIGFQLGLDWRFFNQNRLELSFAWYDFRNIEGVRNTLDSNLQDETAVGYAQRGNTLFNISNSTDPDDFLLGLAADYNLANIMFKYRFANYAPINIDFVADYVRNVGYDKNDVLLRSGGALLATYGNTDGEAEVNGYQIKMDIGWPSITLRDRWKVSLGYRYLERDAVIDGFSDSDFHLGGTDAKGWFVYGKYAVYDNTWFKLKLISTDEISSQPLGVDTLQLDLNARF